MKKFLVLLLIGILSISMFASPADGMHDLNTNQGGQGNPQGDPPSDNNAKKNPKAIFDNFDGDSLDWNVWNIQQRVWGGWDEDRHDYKHSNNGGVVMENVEVKDGMLILHARGNQYNGDIAGVNRGNGQQIIRKTPEEFPDTWNKLTGAAISTKKYYSSCIIEYRAKLPRKLGVASAMWTFAYHERIKTQENNGFRPKYQGYFTRGKERYIEGVTYPAYKHYYDVATKPVIQDDGVWVVEGNSEVDIEFPGRPNQNSLEGITYNRCLFNWWIGEGGNGSGAKPIWSWNDYFNSIWDINSSHWYEQIWDEYQSTLPDLGQDMRYGGTVGPDGLMGWHTYKIAWHAGGLDSNGIIQKKRVELYIDGILIETSVGKDPEAGPYGDFDDTVYVPTLAAKAWLAVFFPRSRKLNKETGEYTNNFWAGEAEWVHDQMLVDYFSLTPLDEANNRWDMESYPNYGEYNEKGVGNADQ